MYHVHVKIRLKIKISALTNDISYRKLRFHADQYGSCARLLQHSVKLTVLPGQDTWLILFVVVVSLCCSIVK